MQAFPDAMRGKRMVVLDIPDEYRYMDTEPVDALMQPVPAALFAVMGR